MIPDFLLRKEKTEKTDADLVCDLLEQYSLKFGEDLCTEMIIREDREWIRILKKCIDTNQSYWIITGETPITNAYI